MAAPITEKDTKTKDDLVKLHSELIANGENNDAHTLELVKIIGGIDQILSDYLTKDDERLNSKQINALHQFLSTPSKYKIKNKTVPQIIITNDVDSEQESDEFQYKMLLHAENTISHSVFNDKIGAKLYSFVWSKTMWIVLTLVLTASCSVAFFTQLISRVIGKESDVDSFRYWYLIVMSCFLIPLFILLIMSLNRIVVIIVLKTFEFWFKIYYAAVSQFAWVVYKYILLGEEHSLKEGIIANVMLGVLIILAIAAVSMSDGNKVNYIAGYLWFVLVFLGAMYYAYWSFIMEFFSFDADGRDPSIITISSDIHLSMISMLATAYRIVSIFLFKQAVVMFVRLRNRKYHKTMKAICIRIAPTLEWDSTTLSNQSHPIIDEKIKSISNQSENINDFQQQKEEVYLEEMNIETKPHKKEEDESISTISIHHDDLDGTM